MIRSRAAPAILRTAVAKLASQARHTVATSSVSTDGSCLGRSGRGSYRSRSGSRGSSRRARPRTGAGPGSVPVLLRIAETLADGDGTVAVADERLEHVFGQVVDDLPVDVVLDVKEAVDARVGGVDGVVPDVLAGLNLVGLGVQVTLGVEVKVGDVVAQVVHYLLAECRAAGVGRAHVGREEAEDVVDGDLVIHHLVDNLLLCQLGSILVRPGVAGDLVAFIVHPLDDGETGVSSSSLDTQHSTLKHRGEELAHTYLDDIRPGCAWVVDLTLADVGAGDEEGRLGVVLGEQVQEVVCVQVRPVIIRDGDVTGLLASIDARAAVRDRANARTSDVPRIRAIGDFVGIAARTVVDLAVRGAAVLGASAAPAAPLLALNTQHSSIHHS